MVFILISLLGFFCPGPWENAPETKEYDKHCARDCSTQRRIIQDQASQEEKVQRDPQHQRREGQFQKTRGEIHESPRDDTSFGDPVVSCWSHYKGNGESN